MMYYHARRLDMERIQLMVRLVLALLLSTLVEDASPSGRCIDQRIKFMGIEQA